MKYRKSFLTIAVVIAALVLAGCPDPGGGGGDTTKPTVSSTSPAALATGVAVAANITATFSEAMTATTIVAANFTLAAGGAVTGVVSYDATTKIATFNPTSDLSNSTVYTATITTGVKDSAGNALAANKVWTFTTVAAVAQGPAAVNLGTAANYAVLAKSAISTTGVTAVTGDLGISPAAASLVTGFALIMDGSGQFSTSSLVTGNVYASDYSVPTPANLITAVGDMETAYTDAATRTPAVGANLNMGAGTINGVTLTPGLYTWGTDLNITGNITISGSSIDRWIFQISGFLSLANGAQIILSGGALPQNIVWQVAGTGATLGTTSHFEGIILALAAITANTGATMNGRALAQTAVTLNATTLVEP
jgi:hypothetical protein